ncbi:niacin transporter [Clostridium sp. USBA 49]|uniref:ECF transporter S component n=1 Tax=Clostridium sp. USBA 49 TaxID=1881060 RepID=UPI0009994046|nr:ECF transporter S component [Clostridium sp. USBA 49]SKA72842.1 niacin transporter [Clostridium sp. USBA 49]
MKDIKKLTYTALLTAWAMIIPFVFGFMTVVIGPFTATITSHVPMFLSMFLGPQAAVITGIGSALGFFMTKGPLVGLRALMHSFVGLMGALLIQKNVSFPKVVFFTAPVHGILEAMVVFVFVALGAEVKYTGSLANFLIITVLVGSILHHTVDGLISWALSKSLSKASNNKLIKEKA